MINPRSVVLEHEAVIALTQILGIMLDQMFDVESRAVWEVEDVIDLEARLSEPAEGSPITLGIDDVALLLQGMAFTEVMSEDLPWIDTVRWVTDFVTAELRNIGLRTNGANLHSNLQSSFLTLHFGVLCGHESSGEN